MGHKINTGGMSTSKYQLLFPERRLRGGTALLWKIAHACKGTNINLQTKFKCLCDSRWRLKIASASGSAGTLVFMILLLFRNSKLDQWETLLSWPVVQFAARKYRHWNLTNYVNKYIAVSGGQSQNGKLVVFTNSNQWNLANTVKKLNKSITFSSEQSQSVKLVVLANAKRWNLTNTVEKLNKSNASWEQKRSGNPGVLVEWL